MLSLGTLRHRHFRNFMNALHWQLRNHSKVFSYEKFLLWCEHLSVNEHRIFTLICMFCLIIGFPRASHEQSRLFWDTFDVNHEDRKIIEKVHFHLGESWLWHHTCKHYDIYGKIIMSDMALSEKEENNWKNCFSCQFREKATSYWM